MTIGKKLTISFVAMLALVGALSYDALVSIQQLGKDLDKAVNSTAKQIDLAQAAGAKFYAMQAAARGILISLVSDDSGRVTANMEDFRVARGSLAEQIAQIRPLLESDAGRQAVQRIEGGLSAWMPLHDQYVEHGRQKRLAEAQKLMAEKIAPIFDDIGRAIEALVQVERDLLARSAEAGRQNVASSFRITFIIIGLSLVVGTVVMLVIRQVNRSLRQVASELAEGAQQVASAAAQVSSSGQSLAQGASEQAASLQETSASSEEITSMTRKNAENSKAAASLAAGAENSVTDANRTLEEMLTSMREINASSDRIAKIIKVIDEIAFQTNILALNAAVEAARAGEAGMGFAVVADEVRNLAQRSAQAAKDTAGLIEESISKTSEGSTKLDRVAAAIAAITEQASKVRTLSDEVNLGSQEQARGMDQISQAVAQMEQVTQKTAANAEESAAAGEQLSAQAETLNDIVRRLSAMVGGGDAVTRRSAAHGQPARLNSREAAGGQYAADTRGLQRLHSAVAPLRRQAEPAQLEAVRQGGAAAKADFPLDGDFKEF